jgi:hypothetical protein
VFPNGCREISVFQWLPVKIIPSVGCPGKSLNLYMYLRGFKVLRIIAAIFNDFEETASMLSSWRDK